MDLESLFKRIKLKESSTLPEKDQWYLENRRHTQEMMKTGTWTYELGNDTVYFTDEYYHIFETIPDQLGKNVESYFQFICQYDVSKVKTSRELALQGQDQELEYQIITDQGNQKFVREKTRTLLDELGNPVKIIGVLQDITSEKIIDNSLKELGENLNAQTKSV